MRGLFVALIVGLAACSSSSPDSAVAPAAGEASAHAASGAVATPSAAVAGEAVAYFAGGCFWGVEHYMEALDGVIEVESGYMGGHVDAPSYEEVSSAESGHLETVKVRYDPARVPYENVAKLFFEIHDPTQANGQGPDIGSMYLSAVFYNDANEKKIAESLIDKLETRGFEVVTFLKPADKFFAAEDYHQNYYVKTGKKPYCHTRVDRFGE